ncbi:hypothetical protein MGN01_01450 [Methylobacterium gnaphalii]|uniref:Uncharacterized protein n=1 Tax=Methylobacterium gnaphalii TaxID=1010610 RepID=A0A512JED6_9HYPH|nr:hypothetical protein MGN01_01450 [Methylobacterium gnaphalii]GLS51069.1 hypothetical protein GCM10007885_39230 [Methylobacterium gnaphalii]
MARPARAALGWQRGIEPLRPAGLLVDLDGAAALRSPRAVAAPTMNGVVPLTSAARMLGAALRAARLAIAQVLEKAGSRAPSTVRSCKHCTDRLSNTGQV